MHWLAVLPPEHARQAWVWRALRFTPRVAWVDEALLLEVSASHRLWGGPVRLLRRFFGSKSAQAGVEWSQAATSLIAIAMLRLAAGGAQPARGLLHDPAALPLHTLSAARPHLATLARMGCNTWGSLRALPRAGVARRFGAGLLAALDTAWGEQPESYPWLSLPEVFDESVELMALATSADELLWAAQRLLGLLQAWLRARQRGVLACELEWQLDLRRLNGVALPTHQRLVLRTARPTQGMAHLRRLLAEQLARSSLAAPASHLRLRTLETTPWAGSSASLLLHEQAKGEHLHELIERLSARLGADHVLLPLARADHRPEQMQRWVRAQGATNQPAGRPYPADALYPTWLLAQPLRLQVQRDVPQFHGPLRRLTRAQRIETAWWEAVPSSQQLAHSAALRDYFVARSALAGWLWIYRERPAAEQDEVRWFLQGIYA